MTQLAVTERAELANLLDRLGPHAPTLCTGWHTSDLTAHLVLRESRPDAALGIWLPAAAGWTKRVQDHFAASNYPHLVNRLRTGPAHWSPLRLHTLDEGANNVELFVHHEDVRRATPHWQSRALDAATEDLLWRRATKLSRWTLRDLPAGIDLVRSDTEVRHTGRRPAPGQSVVTLIGMPQELVMFIMGRRAHAKVEHDGDPAAWAAREES